MRLVKRLAQISATLLRLATGIGGAAVVFVALKGKNRKGPSGRPDPKSLKE